MRLIAILFSVMLIMVQVYAEETNISDELILVEGGKFTSVNSENVEVASFYIGATEVTFDEYDNYCSKAKVTMPSDNKWGRKNMPVINVSWLDAVKYCNWKSKQEKLPAAYSIVKGIATIVDKNGKQTTDLSKVEGYRLPTEAEWEYAARGGNKSKGYEFSGGDDADAVSWYFGNSDDKSHPVKTKAPNELEIYDMSGSVWEWCTDYFSNEPFKDYVPGNYYSQKNKYNEMVIKGGSYINTARILKSVAVYSRFCAKQTTKNEFYGFRIAKSKGE